jgi:4-hydroxybenzoate polyprenyltransferase
MPDVETIKPADALRDSWVDVGLPASWRPYARLARLDRPIGTWLLLWPCWQGAALAVNQTQEYWTFGYHLALFAIGALVMRGAGCTYNDIVDRDLDARVARTAGRPIPSGQVSVRAAVIFMIAQTQIGLLVLLQFNEFTIWLGLLALAPVAIYPFMKRITNWPQAVLGLTFNWGALVGWSAAAGDLSMSAIALYAGCWAWTMGYDTIYAHQDKEDDSLIGIGSTALALGEWSKPFLGLFYGVAVVLWAVSGELSGLGGLFWIGLALTAAHMAWQALTVDLANPQSCLKLFRANRETGLILFAAILAGSNWGLD